MTTTPPGALPVGAPVVGVEMDAQTRCAHYASPLDVVALRMDCCAVYWCCHLCHAELADHPAVPVPARDAAEPRVLCGVCRTELSVRAYREAMESPIPVCPSCGVGFNPGCALHAELYFEADPVVGGAARAAAGAPTGDRGQGVTAEDTA